MIKIKGLEECVHLVALPGPHAPYLILGGGQLTSQFKNISEEFLVRANECSFAFLKVSQTWCNHFRMGKYQSLNVYEIVLSSADYWWWYVFLQMPSKKACLKKSYYMRKNVPFQNCSKTPQEASIANNPPLTYQWCTSNMCLLTLSSGFRINTDIGRVLIFGSIILGLRSRHWDFVFLRRFECCQIFHLWETKTLQL